MAFGFILALLSCFLVEKNSASELMCSGLKQLQYPKNLVDVEDNGTSFRVEGFKFPASSIQEFKNEIFTVCPCKVQQCIEHCSNLEDSERSLSRTRPFLPLHSVLYRSSPDIKKKPIQVRGKSWIIDDLFKQYFVVQEALYVKTPSYTKLDLGDVSLDDLSRVCFAFSEENQVNFYERQNEVSQAYNIFAICCAVSVGCLGILLVLFVITNEINLFEGRCIFCHSLMLMASFVGLILNYWSLVPLNTPLCYVTGEILFLLHIFVACAIDRALAFGIREGFSSYFAFMSAFFWLNVMCIDMYWTSSIRLSSKKDSLIFWKYFTYAFSLPAMLTLGLIWNHLFYEPSRQDTFKADIGKNLCYLSTNFEENYEIAVAFLHGPLVIILLVNFFLFCLTLNKIFKVFADKKSSDEKNSILKVLMYIKASVIVGGFTWIMEFAGWFNKTSNGIWFAFDIINCLSGLWLLIFCVFLNNRVHTSLMRKLNCRTTDHKVSSSACNTDDAVPAVDKIARHVPHRGASAKT